MTALLGDLRYAARSLRKSPGFAAAAVATLALGIGATTAVFSVVNAVLLKPLPYAEPDRLVRIWSAWEGSPRSDVSPAEYFDDRDGLLTFASVGAFAGGTANLTGDGEPERLAAAYTTASLIQALGVPAAFGRVFRDGEDVPNAEASVVLGDGLWRRRFGSDPNVIGRRIMLDGVPHTVLGVMPAGFRMPGDFGAADPAELYLPLGLDRTSIPNRGSHFLGVVGRLRPGVSFETGRTEVSRLAAGFVRDFPDDYPPGMRFTASAVPLTDDVAGPIRPALLVLLGAVGFVLAIACANVAGLLLSRTEERRREMALRTALGAGRGRLAHQLLVESLLIASLGGALGLALAVGGVGALAALRPPELARLQEVGVDLKVLAFTAMATLATGLAFGLAPALIVSRADLHGPIKEGGRGVTAGHATQRVRRLLVAGEIGVALVLLVGGGLLGRSLARLQGLDPGFRPDNVLTVTLALPDAEYADHARITGFYRDLVHGVGSLPGVRSAGAVTALPLDGERGDLNVHIEGRPEAAGAASPAADWQVVTPGYMRALGMRVLRGRGIEGTDDGAAPGAVVINRTMARLLWPGEDPLGRRFLLGGGAGPGWVTIVGIVDDVRQAALAAEPRPEMYLPHAQFRFWDGGGPVTSMTLAVRSAGDPASLANAIRSQVHALDPDLPVGAFRSMPEIVSASLARPRFTTVLLAVFAAVALTLAAVGIYGILSQAAARRAHEIGVRMALGARPPDVLRLFLRQTLALAGWGVALGLFASLALTRVLSSQLYGVSPSDPPTYAALAAFMIGVAVLATWIPTRRAARVDPLSALREE
jgi:putative ABC transport system permease protein